MSEIAKDDLGLVIIECIVASQAARWMPLRALFVRRVRMMN